MIEFVSFLVIIVALIGSAILNFNLRNKIKSVNNDLGQALLDASVIAKKLAEEVEKNNAKEIEQSDGFLKFISDSRNSAFSYIEEVQDALHNFDKIINETSGLTPKQALSKILGAYKELKSFLPDDKK